MTLAEQMYKSLSNDIQACIDTGNEPRARAVLTAAKNVIENTPWQELRQDFETAFGDFE